VTSLYVIRVHSFPGPSVATCTELRNLQESIKTGKFVKNLRTAVDYEEWSLLVCYAVLPKRRFLQEPHGVTSQKKPLLKFMKVHY
jgi:hypothetical protein